MIFKQFVFSALNSLINTKSVCCLFLVFVSEGKIALEHNLVQYHDEDLGRYLGFTFKSLVELVTCIAEEVDEEDNSENWKRQRLTEYPVAYDF